MRDIKYVEFDKLDPEAIKSMLNKSKIREHLIEHQLFDSDSIRSWIQEKQKVGRTGGCRVRGIVLDEDLAGWCGIQLEDDKYEIAIVLDNKYWGIGKQVFTEILNWAKELGHSEVYIHFLHTRPEYKFLRKISKNVCETEMLGNKFTSYQISVR